MCARFLSRFLAAVLIAGCASRPGGGPTGENPSAVSISGYEPVTAERLAAEGWDTDFSRVAQSGGTIVTAGLSREAIVPVRNPRHAAAAGIDLDPAEPVLVLRGEDEVHAWPLAHLLKRELALDEAGGVPVAVTFCSVCGTARLWDRRVDGRVLELGVSGLLLDGNSLLWDAATESLWRQIDGRAVAGAMAGAAMESLPAFVVSFGVLAAARPDARVMLTPEPAPDPPFRTLSGSDVARGEPPAWLAVACPRPLEPALVVGESPVLAVAGPPVEHSGDLVVFRDSGAGTAYRTAGGGPSEPWGGAAAFRRDLDGRSLTFEPVPAAGRGPASVLRFRDRETGSGWNLLGEAVEGPLAGRALRVADQILGFRFAVAP